jgi:hypothetical protein
MIVVKLFFPPFGVPFVSLALSLSLSLRELPEANSSVKEDQGCTVNDGRALKRTSAEVEEQLWSTRMKSDCKEC